MNTEGFKRKLTAVFSADVVGYSRLMGGDVFAAKSIKGKGEMEYSFVRLSIRWQK